MTRVLPLLTLTVAFAGLVDAAMGDAWDLVVLFATVVALQVAALVLAHLGRRSIVVRRDLATWIDEQAAVRGESPSMVAERAVAAYRAGLTADPRT